MEPISVSDIPANSENEPTQMTPARLENAVSVQDISKSFHGVRVLESISFDVAEGESLVLLGASGSGKTTILRIIAGLEAPDSGRVILRGRDVTDLPAQERSAGVIFQSYALFPRMTVEENIAYGLKIRRCPRREIEETVDHLLALVRLERHRKKYPAQLSGGQQQRVAIARTLAYKPEVLLFDEAFGALDTLTRVRLRREIRALLKEIEVPAIFITHDQEEALEIGDRIAVINEGRIEQLDSPFEIYNHPRNEYVATFLGAANVLLGRWCEGRVSVGSVRLKAPPEIEAFAERQPVKIVFRPEDAALNFQPQLLDTPYYLGSAVVEEISYTGPVERSVLRLSSNSPVHSVCAPQQNGDVDALEERRVDGLAITVIRSKYDASDLALSVGDAVVVGLKDYRLLAHYPLRAETKAGVY